MAYNLNIREEAKQDIVSGYLWYENKSQGLGSKFIKEVETVLLYIEKFPEHFQIKNKYRYREAILRIFPYVIIYEIIEDQIVIYSVFPTPMNPKKKP